MATVVSATVSNQPEQLVSLLIHQTTKRQLFGKDNFGRVLLCYLAHIVDGAGEVNGQNLWKYGHSSGLCDPPLGRKTNIAKLDILRGVFGICVNGMLELIDAFLGLRLETLGRGLGHLGL